MHRPHSILERLRMRRICVLCIALSSIAIGQSSAPIPYGRVSSILEGVVDQAGTRFRQPSQGRWTANLQILNGEGQQIATCALTTEWRGKVALAATGYRAVFGPGATPWVVANGGSDTSDDVTPAITDVAEIIAEDTLDGFLEQHLGGTSFRIIGTGYPSPVDPNSACTVVQLWTNSFVRATDSPVNKQYWFDAKTGRLVLVRHQDGTTVRLLNYVQLGTNEFPSRAEVRDANALKYIVNLTPVLVSASVNDGTFDAGGGVGTNKK